MFVGGQIEALVEHFNQRGVSLYHSCQLKDFRSYLKLGGIPSRQLLTDCGLSFTEFDTDYIDQKNGVWDKVFLNPVDFGAFFARGNAATPTTYGPIAFVFYPDVLLEAQDVAVCLRSAGASDFKREEESLSSVQEVDTIFVCPKEHDFPRSIEIKSEKVLERDHPSKKVRGSPEISCSCATSRLSFKQLSYIYVDPYCIRGKALERLVEEELCKFGFTCEVKVRQCPRSPIYSELADTLGVGYMGLDDLLSLTSASSDMREWAKGLKRNNLGYQWERYAKYLIAGTLIAFQP